MANRITLQHDDFPDRGAQRTAHWAGPREPVPGPPERIQLRRACQRGMATAEYAVGILAAVALALVLLKIFNDNEFFTTMLRFVLDLIGRVGGMVG